MLRARCRLSSSVLALPFLCFVFAAQLSVVPAYPARNLPRAADAQTTTSPSARITGPTLGFLFDVRSGALFRLPGIAGAASLGDRLEVGARLSQAVVGPQQDFVLATRAGDREALVIRFISSIIEASSLGAATAGVDRISLSPGGVNAALFHAAQRKLTVLTGLPRSPVIVRSLDTSVLNGELTALAIGDDPDHVLVALAEGESGGISAVRQAGNIVPVYTGGRVTAIRFLAGRDHAAFADASSDRVYLARGVSSQVTLELLASEQDGIAAPIAIETSRDSRSLFVANADSGVITMLDLSQRSIEQFSCLCKPTRLNRLTGDSVFQLTDPSEQPVKVFDGGARGPRVLVIPGTASLANGPPAPSRGRSRSREPRQ